VAGVTRSILRLRAKPGRRDELVELFDRLGIFAAAREQDGFLAAELQISLDDADELVVTATWARPEAYDGWLANPIRAELGAQLEPLLDGDPEPRTYLIVRELRGT
jgi:quinol monooxygenase YgiN